MRKNTQVLHLGICLVGLLAGRAAAQFDCNGNGIADAIDIASGTATDCNNNGIPDSCDLTDSLGLSVAQSIPAGALPQSLVLADINHDGKIDLVVVNRNTTNLTVLLNDGAGHFTTQTIALPFAAEAVVAADFNKDGLDDLATADFVNNSVTILLNTTTAGVVSFGVPTTLAAGSNPTAIAALDLNGDGNLDLAVADQTGNTISKLLNSGTGVFVASGTQAVGQEPVAMVTADFDGDNKPDLAVANFVSNNLSILLTTTPTIQTTSATLGAPFALAAGDFGSGFKDLAVANSSSSTILILRNNGTGVFTAGETLSGVTTPVALATADLNGDGKLDLVAAGSNGITTFLGQGNGTFLASRTAPAITGVNSVVVANLAGTGNEIAVANETAGQVQILQNSTNPPFSKDCNGNGVPDECEPGVAGTCTDSGTTPPAPAGCGAGTCGTGAATMSPLLMLGIMLIKSSYAGRRRVR
jgi:hypothetical protein